MPFPPRLVPAAGEVEYLDWHPRPWLLGFIGALVLGICLGGSLLLLWPRGWLAPYEYHLWRWEADTVLGNVFARIGIGPDPVPAASEAALRSYFKLTSELRAAEDAPSPDPALIDTLTNERSNYSNDVERVLERYITEAVTSAGLDRELPLFSGVSLTWPPVDFKLITPPQLLVRSRRDKVVRSGDTLLRSGLTLQQIENIEAKSDNSTYVSIVVPIGGLAAYPAIVESDTSYDALVDTSSHEWVHHYLAFFPLGQQFYTGPEGETLNETTANIAGREIGNLIRKAHPLTLPAGADGNTPAGPAPTVDFSAEMQKLRQQVDALLSAENISGAEQAMEDERQYLDAHGITIRKINQAYFAFYGTYGDTAQASSPIGPKVEKVWSLTKDVGLFLEVMRDVTSEHDLDIAIQRLTAASNG
ncbi:MAG TPA: hypothetical protein VIK11_06485 [Tepidiformaceae bacterium]